MEYDGFDGSNAVRIILKTGLDFGSEAPTSSVIMWVDPDGNSGTWTASILVGSESEGKIYYDLTTSDSLIEGNWKLKAKLTYSDNRVLYSEWANMLIGD